MVKYAVFMNQSKKMLDLKLYIRLFKKISSYKKKFFIIVCDNIRVKIKI